MAKKTKSSIPAGSMSFPIVNPNAAGIDIGDLLIAVAVPQDRDTQPVREFGALQKTYSPLPRGSDNVGLIRLQWSAPECIGRTFTPFLLSRGSVCALPTYATRKTGRAGRRTCPTRNGYSNSLATCSSPRRSYPMTLPKSFVHWCASAGRSHGIPHATSCVCRRPWS